MKVKYLPIYFLISTLAITSFAFAGDTPPTSSPVPSGPSLIGQSSSAALTTPGAKAFWISLNIRDSLTTALAVKNVTVSGPLVYAPTNSEDPLQGSFFATTSGWTIFGAQSKSPLKIDSAAYKIGSVVSGLEQQKILYIVTTGDVTISLQVARGQALLSVPTYKLNFATGSLVPVTATPAPSASSSQSAAYVGPK